MALNGDTPTAACGAHKRQGEGLCQRPAGWGTDHVGIGACKLHGGCVPNHAIAAARTEVVQAVQEDVPVDPATALLRCVHLASSQVEYATQQIAHLKSDGEQVDAEIPASPWGRVQAEAMERLAKFSKMALDAGVAERQVLLAERWGAQIADVLNAIFAELELTEEQKAQAQEVIRRHLLALESGYAAATN